MITINFTKAQAITKDRLRSERAPLLQAQDIEFQRAVESSASTASIIAEKQRLRNITKAVDVATTLDQLKGMNS